jgi:hypothetical protein
MTAKRRFIHLIEFVGTDNRFQTYGDSNLEDEYLMGDWNGDGRH